uniref:Neuropeptide-like protein 31 n=1 Tax=Strongyloides venezuelensis TaxID=75913 RepID=A0A0K0F113_STRVS
MNSKIIILLIACIIAMASAQFYGPGMYGMYGPGMGMYRRGMYRGYGGYGGYGRGMYGGYGRGMYGGMWGKK